MLISPFSAIPSWEGFEYQGYCALYYVLNMILDLIKEGNLKRIDDFKLGLEGEDDFLIIDKHQYISLHQVKSGEIRLKDNDKFCFILSILQYQAQRGYLHICEKSEKSIKQNFVDTSRKLIDEMLNELDKEVKEKGEVSQSSAGEYLFIEDIKANTSKGSVYNILYYVSIKPITKLSVVEAKKKVIKELNQYKLKLNSKDEDDIWEIDKNYFKTKKDIKKKLYDIIKEIILYKDSSREMYLDRSALMFICDHVYLFIKENVEDSNTKERKCNCKIDFKDIYDRVVFQYKEESNTVEFQYYKLLERIEKKFGEYPTAAKTICKFDDCDDCGNKEKCNLYKQINQICQLNVEEQIEFLYKLLLKTPDNDLPNENLVNRLVITLLRKIDKLNLEKSNIILAENKGEYYRLTLDSSGESYELSAQLNNEINKSTNDKLLIYETDVLITDQLNEANFIYDGNKFNVMGDNELRDIQTITSDNIDRQKMNINRPKVMRLIDRKNAEEELL